MCFGIKGLNIKDLDTGGGAEFTRLALLGAIGTNLTLLP